MAIALQAQSPVGWRSWGAADGMQESFVRGLSVSPDGDVWVRHGQIKLMTVMDGYGVRPVPVPDDGFNPVYGERNGQAWTFNQAGLCRYRNSRWEELRIEGFERRITAAPGGDGRALVLFPDRLVEYDLSEARSKIVWTSNAARIGPFTGFAGSLSEGLWITGSTGIGRLRWTGTDRGAGLQWREFPGGPLGLHPKPHKFLKILCFNELINPARSKTGPPKSIGWRLSQKGAGVQWRDKNGGRKLSI